MNIQLEWLLGIGATVLMSLFGALFAMSLQNRARLARHDVLLAQLQGIPRKMDEIAQSFTHALERHEIKEDKQFNDMTVKQDRQFNELSNKVSKLMINVALINKSNGDLNA